MEKETKKYLIIGGVLILTVSVGVVVWKKYQVSSTASAAANDQANQDELSLEAAALADNAYAGSGGSSSFSPQVVGAQTPTSLADEVLALENALGFAPTTTTPTTPSAPPTSGSTSTPTNGGTPAPFPAPGPAQDGTGFNSAGPIVSSLHPATEAIQYNHGSPVFHMDGVQGEEVTVS